jgi:uncharacterized membrane protein
MATTARALRDGGPRLRGSGPRLMGSGPRLGPVAAANTALKVAVGFWFGVVLVGQLFFVAHIVSFYGRSSLSGDFNRWNKLLSRGFVPGDHIGNGALAVHLSMAALITFAGLVQLIPQIRTRFPTLHRWVGRSYIVIAVVASTSALYLSVIRGGTPGGFLQHATIDVDAILILIFAALALRYALARNFAVHRRWATRLFLAVSGVWFFRAGVFFWLLINQGPVGFNPDTFEGPALTILGFVAYFLPLGVFELYWRAQQRGSTASRFAVAATLVVLTLAMAIGVFGHAMFMLTSGAGF